MEFTKIEGVDGGAHVGGVLTTSAANEVSEELLQSEVDSRVTRVRPMATPVDQLGRYASNRAAGSMLVQYYAVDTRPCECKTTEDIAAQAAGDDGNLEVTVKVDDAGAFDATDTLLMPEVTVGSTGAPLVFYVVERLEGNRLKLVAVNGPRNAEGYAGVPTLTRGKRLMRMGRAAGELDVQTAQCEAVPRKTTNYRQIFKAQIEQSTLMRLSNKEVGWTFTDQEEMAVYEMRLGMEKSFLFGSKARIVDPVKKAEVFLTGGIWHQAGRDATYPESGITYEAWLEVMKTAFTGHGASSRKILLAGSELIERLSLMDGGQQRTMLAGDKVTQWGLDFHEIHSKFGTLWVVMSEVMDACGHGGDGLIIDPQYLTKYVHVPFNAAVLDLRTSGQRNSDAVVMTEASCMVLRQPEAHVRVTAEKGRG